MYVDIDVSPDQFFTTELLKYIPKVILLQYYGDLIPKIWNKLPVHIKTDPDLAQYRACLKHYNKAIDHIDGPARQIRKCSQCQERDPSGKVC